MGRHGPSCHAAARRGSRRSFPDCAMTAFFRSLRKWLQWRADQGRFHVSGVAEHTSVGTIVARGEQQWTIEDDQGRFRVRPGTAIHGRHEPSSRGPRRDPTYSARVAGTPSIQLDDHSKVELKPRTVRRFLRQSDTITEQLHARSLTLADASA
jgi:hypothetical protein